MLTRRELLGFRETKLFNTYWPYWFRNIMVDIVTIIGNTREVYMPRLQELRERLQETARPDISNEDKLLVYRLYRWFITQRNMPDITDGSNILHEIPLTYASNLFISASGKLVPSVEKVITDVYAGLRIPLTYNVLRDADVPLVLFVPEDKIRTFMRRMPANILSLCAIVAKDINQVNIDTISIDNIKNKGSSGLFFKNNNEVFGITAAHIVLTDSILDVKFLPNEGLDVAIVRVHQSSINIVPYSYPLRFQDYVNICHRESLPIKVYKIGTQTGLTRGSLCVCMDDPPIVAKKTLQIIFDNRLVQYSGLVGIEWEMTNTGQSIPFAVSGDSGAIVFGMCNGMYHPLGIHCASVVGTVDNESYALELDRNLFAMKEVMLANNLLVGDDYNYANPPHAKTIKEPVDYIPGELDSILNQ